MPTRTLLFSVYADTGGAVAWGVGNSTPSFPSGYSLLAGAPRIATGLFIKFSGVDNTVILDDTVLTGDIIESEVDLGAVTSESEGPVLCSPAGVGWQVLNNSSSTRLFNLTTGGLLGTQVGTSGPAMASGSICRMRYIQSTDTLELYDDGALIKTWTGVTSVNTDWRAGAFVRGGAGISSLSSIYTASLSIDSLTDPLVAGAAFSGTSTGFTDGAATLSSNGLSVDVTVASGACSGTWPIAVDAQPYPTLPKSAQTITLTQGANTATIASDLEQPAGDDIVNFVSPITNDDTYPTYYIEQDGFTADGGQFVFTPYSDLVIAADGEITVTGAGVLVGYFIPATGTGAGNAYYYTFNVIDGSVVSGGRGLSVRGLSVRGLSVSGLSVRGLGGAAAMAGGFPYILPFVLS